MSLERREDELTESLTESLAPVGGREDAKFPSKVYRMISSCNRSDPEIACWADDGTAFVIKNEEKLVSEYLEQYKVCQSSKKDGSPKFQSFVRQLNLYGFRNISKEKGSPHAIFCHENFRRGKLALVGNILRKKSGDSKRSLGESSESSNSHEDNPLNVPMQKRLRWVEDTVEAMSKRFDQVDQEVRTMHNKIDEMRSLLGGHFRQEAQTRSALKRPHDDLLVANKREDNFEDQANVFAEFSFQKQQEPAEVVRGSRSQGPPWPLERKPTPLRAATNLNLLATSGDKWLHTTESLGDQKYCHEAHESNDNEQTRGLQSLGEEANQGKLEDFASKKNKAQFLTLLETMENSSHRRIQSRAKKPARRRSSSLPDTLLSDQAPNGFFSPCALQDNHEIEVEESVKSTGSLSLDRENPVGKSSILTIPPLGNQMDASFEYVSMGPATQRPSVSSWFEAFKCMESVVDGQRRLSVMSELSADFGCLDTAGVMELSNE